MIELPSRTATAIGSLPHRDPAAAARLVLDLLPDLPAVPSLPRRSRWESMLPHALVGLPGIAPGARGQLCLDASRLGTPPAVHVDLRHDAFAGLRAFLGVARERVARVKWQVCGPVTAGFALVDRGLPADPAFALAASAVREHLVVVARAVAEALPDAAQLVVLDEPSFSRAGTPGSPLPRESAIDLLSSALAVVEPMAVTGVHCCGDGDWEGILAAGPSVLSAPVGADLARAAPALGAFLVAGGTVAWGCVPTDGPVGEQAERHWRELVLAWCDLVRAGVDPVRLCRQALLTPACGLGLHTPAQAEGVLRLVAGLAVRLRDEGTASRLMVGA